MANENSNASIGEEHAKDETDRKVENVVKENGTAVADKGFEKKNEQKQNTVETPEKKILKQANGDVKSPLKIPNLKKEQSLLKTPTKTLSPRSPEGSVGSSIGADKKKVPMNKVQVGAAPSPNLKAVRSKIGSLENSSYKPGGGRVKIENRKLEWKAQPRIEAKNETYAPGGGEKKIVHTKLQWNAKPKIGSLENATYKPGGGDKKIESLKLDFKDKAKPKIGSKDNMKHVPGGGTVKTSDDSNKGASSDIEEQKLDIKAKSKVGSLDNVKHKPGGGDKKVFVDKEYLKQIGDGLKSHTDTSVSHTQSPAHVHA